MDVFNFEIFTDDSFELGVKVVNSQTQQPVPLGGFTSIVAILYASTIPTEVSTTIDSDGYILFKVPLSLTATARIFPVRIKGLVDFNTRRTLAAGFIEVFDLVA